MIHQFALPSTNHSNSPRLSAIGFLSSCCHRLVRDWYRTVSLHQCATACLGLNSFELLLFSCSGLVFWFYRSCWSFSSLYMFWNICETDSRARSLLCACGLHKGQSLLLSLAAVPCQTKCSSRCFLRKSGNRWPLSIKQIATTSSCMLLTLPV